LALAVPLSRFTSRVGGGSAFFVRPLGRVYYFMSTPKNPNIELQAVALTTMLKNADEFDHHQIEKLRALKAELDIIFPPDKKIMRVESIHR
jgi:hypothetical protein